MATPRLFIATKAFIIYDGKVLILREASMYADGSNAGRLTYPVVGWSQGNGSMTRSVGRSLKKLVSASRLASRSRSVSGVRWCAASRGRLLGVYFACRASSATVQVSDEHYSYEWIDPQEYEQYPLIDIDNVRPIFAAYLRRWHPR